MANELTSLANAKEHLNIPVSETSQDTILTRFIGQASKTIERYLDRFIIKREYIEFQDGRNQNRIMLRNYPADKPSELRIDHSSEFTDADTLIETDDYEIDTLGNEVIFIERIFPRGTRNIKITYDAGFTTVPEDIESACLWMVEWYFDIRGSRNLTEKSRGKNQESTRWRDDWPDWLTRQLDAHKRGPLDFIANAPVENR